MMALKDLARKVRRYGRGYGGCGMCCLVVGRTCGRSDSTWLDGHRSFYLVGLKLATYVTSVDGSSMRLSRCPPASALPHGMIREAPCTWQYASVSSMGSPGV